MEQLGSTPAGSPGSPGNKTVRRRSRTTGAQTRPGWDSYTPTSALFLDLVCPGGVDSRLGLLELCYRIGAVQDNRILRVAELLVDDRLHGMWDRIRVDGAKLDRVRE